MHQPESVREAVPITGFALAEFEPLTEIFARLVGSQRIGGAALSVVHDGVQVVDLVAGTYRQESLQLLFSVSKSVTAIAAAVAHAEGLLDLDAPLSDCWPAFARKETSKITARQVLGHRSGLAAFDRVLTFQQLLNGEDVSAIEVQHPYWEPDSAHGYHYFTYGTLMNGVFERTLGCSVGQFVAEKLAAPLGLDLWIGAPPEVLTRLEHIHYEPESLTAAQIRNAARNRIPGSIISRLQQNVDLFNDPALATASWPGMTGVAGARDLARLLGATMCSVDGVRVLDDTARQAMVATRSRGPDRVLGSITHFGSGVALPSPQLPLLGPRSFGHEGAGGSAVLADEELGLAVGYTTNVFPSNRGASVGFLALQASIRYCAIAAQSIV